MRNSIGIKDVNNMNDQKEQNYLFIIFILFESLYFIIIGFIISNLVVDNNISTNSTALPIASIIGLPTSISDIESNTIGRSLYTLMLNNTIDKQVLNQNAFATIDTNSERLYYFESQGFSLYSTSLDVPNLNQSYKLFYGYPDNGESTFQQFTSILCVKAPTSTCSSFLDYTEIDIAQSFLPYVNFESFSIFFDKESPQNINITPLLPTNDNTTIETSYVNKVKSTLDTLGISPELFTYHVLSSADYTYNIND